MATAHDFTGLTLSGRYRLDSLLGAGAFATVYFARDLKTYDREVAIKVLHPEHTQNRDYVDRFHQEVRVAAKIATRYREHLVQIIDQGVCAAHSPALVYFVMEYIDGVSLRALVADMRSGVRVQRQLAWQRAVSLAQQLCRAIAPLHAHGVIHRDIKPENCLIERRNDREVIKLLDLGIAKVAADSWSTSVVPTTDVRMVLGTPRYMAPEQMLGYDVDRRADIYAVGVILYEFLTGKTPRRLQMAEMEAGAIPSEPLPPSQVAPDLAIPPGLDAAVMRAISWRREDRFARAEAFAAALEDASRSVPSRLRGITSRITQPFLHSIVTRRVHAATDHELAVAVLPVANAEAARFVDQASARGVSRWVWASRRLGGVMVWASTVSGLVFALAMMLVLRPQTGRQAVRPLLHDVMLTAAVREPAPQRATLVPTPAPSEAGSGAAVSATPVAAKPAAAPRVSRRTGEEIVRGKQAAIKRACGVTAEPRVVDYSVRFVPGSRVVSEVSLLGQWSRSQFPEFNNCVGDIIRGLKFSRAVDLQGEIRGTLEL